MQRGGEGPTLRHAALSYASTELMAHIYSLAAIKAASTTTRRLTTHAAILRSPLSMSRLRSNSRAAAAAFSRVSHASSARLLGSPVDAGDGGPPSAVGTSIGPLYSPRALALGSISSTWHQQQHGAERLSVLRSAARCSLRPASLGASACHGRRREGHVKVRRGPRTRPFLAHPPV